MSTPTKGRFLAQDRISERPRRGLATEEVRRHNLAAVLGRLHLGGPMSRSELARQTGLNRSTIRDLITQLTSLELVVENKGTPTSGPGRPSSIASVSPTGAVVLAIELEVDSIAVATVGLGGHIFGERREANRPDNIAPEEVVSRLAALADPLLSDLPLGHRLVGAGVAVAGIVRRSDGFVHMAPNLAWHNVAIGEMIRERMGIELVRVANEADLGALGEFRRGSASQGSHIIFVAGEVGVGIGVIHEATPMLGSSGYAGEAGHAVVNPDGRECRCGSRGCWETEVGEEALIRRVGMEDWSDGSPLEEILRRAQQGDIQTLSGLMDVGRWLGIGIGNLINIFNPDVVIVGGFFDSFYPFMAGALDAGAREVTLEAPWKICDIRRSELGTRAMLIGAAELVLGEVVADPSAFVDSPATA